MEKNVVFRRINGRVVPIRSKNGESKRGKDKKHVDAEKAVKMIGTSAAVAGASTYAQIKGADKGFQKINDAINEAIDKLKRRKPQTALIPGRPNFSDFKRRATSKVDPLLANTVLGQNTINKKANINFRKATYKYNKNLRGLTEEFAKHSDDFTRVKPKIASLRFARKTFSKYHRMMWKWAPRAVAGAAAFSALYTAGEIIYTNYFEKNKG